MSNVHNSLLKLAKQYFDSGDIEVSKNLIMLAKKKASTCEYCNDKNSKFNFDTMKNVCKSCSTPTDCALKGCKKKKIKADMVESDGKFFCCSKCVKADKSKPAKNTKKTSSILSLIKKYAWRNQEVGEYTAEQFANGEDYPYHLQETIYKLSDGEMGDDNWSDYVDHYVVQHFNNSDEPIFYLIEDDNTPNVSNDSRANELATTHASSHLKSLLKKYAQYEDHNNESGFGYNPPEIEVDDENLEVMSHGYDAARDDYSSGIETSNPYDPESPESKLWKQGYDWFLSQVEPQRPDVKY